ncbi:hypothetical protein PMAYCL1PPCAC_09733, partial [Pristionchus mayeri]
DTRCSLLGHLRLLRSATHCHSNLSHTRKVLRRSSPIRRMRAEDVLLPEKYVLCGLREGTAQRLRLRMHSTGCHYSKDETHLN